MEEDRRSSSLPYLIFKFIQNFLHPCKRKIPFLLNQFLSSNDILHEKRGNTSRNFFPTTSLLREFFEFPRRRKSIAIHHEEEGMEDTKVVDRFGPSNPRITKRAEATKLSAVFPTVGGCWKERERYMFLRSWERERESCRILAPALAKRPDKNRLWSADC